MSMRLTNRRLELGLVPTWFAILAGQVPPLNFIRAKTAPPLSTLEKKPTHMKLQ